MEKLKHLLTGVLRNNNTGEAWNWISARAPLIANEVSAKALNVAFAATPRYTGRKLIDVTQAEKDELSGLEPRLCITGWTTDRLARVWLLMFVKAVDKDAYVGKIEDLFSGAEMHELVALYSALPVYEFPEAWKWRCTEGIRSNIGDVLEAIMYENPYPSVYLDNAAWNQLVMKAFFTDKEVDRIYGLDKRANAELSTVLIDYANERWAAHRKVNIQLWRLVAGFIDDSNFYMLEKLYLSGNPAEKKAAILACSKSKLELCTRLTERETHWMKDIAENRLTWSTLVEESKNLNA
jgi:hypothetical protein